MSRTITLHGGPYHGHTVTIPEGHDHFHIVGSVSPEDSDPIEGTYSQVSGPERKNDFEWDGWVSH